MNIFGEVLSNGFVPLVPVFAWNFLLASKLPSPYHPSTFDKGIPTKILIGEIAFRIIVFLMPLFCQLDITTDQGKFGLFLFLTGIALYFISWTALIYAPESFWDTNVFIFASPAYTPVLWLTGLGLMIDSYYFGMSYSPYHFILPVIVFTVFHTSHSVLVFNRAYQ